MRTTILILVIFFISLTQNIKAQNYFNGKTFSINLGCNELDYDGIEFLNNKTYPLILNWTKLLDDTVSGSRFDMCANSECYVGVPDTGSNLTFPVLQNKIGFFKMHFWSGDSSGTSTMKIYVYEASLPNNGDTLTYFLNILCSTNSINSTNQISNNVSIYPNPSKGVVHISLKEATNSSITLRNSLGQILLADKYSLTDQIDLNLDFPIGFYFLQIEAFGEISTRKVVIE